MSKSNFCQIIRKNYKNYSFGYTINGLIANFAKILNFHSIFFNFHQRAKLARAFNKEENLMIFIRFKRIFFSLTIFKRICSKLR